MKWQKNEICSNTVFIFLNFSEIEVNFLVKYCSVYAQYYAIEKTKILLSNYYRNVVIALSWRKRKVIENLALLLLIVTTLEARRAITIENAIKKIIVYFASFLYQFCAFVY